MTCYLRALAQEEERVMRSAKLLTADSLARFVAFDEATEEETITVSLPEDLSALSDAEITELLNKVTEAFNALYVADADIDADTENVLLALGEARAALQAVADGRTEAAEARKARVAALAAKVNGTEDAAPGDDEDAEDENEDAADEAEESDEAEDAVEETAEVTAEAEAEVVAEAEAAVAEAAEELEAVAASGEEAPKIEGRTISVTKLRSRQTPVEAPAVTTPRTAFRAAVNVPGIVPGVDLDLDQVAAAFSEMVSRAPKAHGSGRFSQRHAVAQIEKEFDPRAVVDNGSDVDAAIRFAVDQSRLPGGSLTAAGGWCAPSETVYDLCELESTDGLVSLPEINVRRGGVRFTQGPDWVDIFNNTGFCFTEADDIDGNYDGAASPPSAKPTDIVPCPDFTDVRLEVCGVTIQAGNLMNRAYPELVRRYVSGAITAHFHRVATNVIADLVAQSTAVTVTAVGTSGTSNLLSAIELQAEDIKYRYRMARGTVLEVILPFWARGVIRADLSRRQSADVNSALSVSDAEIDAWFRLRGINAQFVYNYQNLGGAAATVFPATVNFLIYPAGTFVRGSSDLITIEMLRDSTLNENNNFTAIFTEEAYSVMKMCHISRNVTVAFDDAGWTNLGTAV